MANGVGVDPAGVARAGLDVVQIPPRYALKPIAAKRYDPAAKAYVVNIDGQYVEDHPVDQWVVQQLMFVRGSIPSASTVGNPALRYKYINANHVAKVTSDIGALLAPRVASKEIEIHAIDVEAKNYATLIRVDYTNLLTSQRRPVEV
jgi:hypothetical protein